MSVIACHGVSKAFGPTVAVEGFELQIEPGEIMALLGPSGCGKTTLLRLIAGFEAPDAGTIEVGERLVASAGAFLPPEKRQVGMVFQDYALFPHLTAAQNVAFGLNGRRAATGAGSVREALALVNLTGMGHRYPHELSGGEQQRVALARAVAPRPVVLLLDEPFSNLDADLRGQMRREVKDILLEAGITTLFVTHDQQEALYMGHRVAVMNQGRLEQVDTPERVFGRPASRFVASFLGRADFLAAAPTSRGLRTEAGLVRQRIDAPNGARLEVMVRPDDIGLRPNPSSAARVIDRIYQGMDNLYRVLMPSGQLIHSLQPHTVSLNLGQGVDVLIEPGHELVVFADGLRLPLPDEEGGEAAARATG